MYKFESATGCKLNKTKTKIFGLGPWRDRPVWPLPWLQGYTGSFTTLGILFSDDYEIAVNSSWTNILCKIKNTLASFHNRRLTLHQKAVIVNTLVFSKTWYISHIYPLPVKYAKLISKEVFFYIWGKKCEFIKRDTLTKSMLEGGLGMVSLLWKTQSILAASFLKVHCDEEYNFMSNYYNNSHMKGLFTENLRQRDNSYIMAPMYSEVLVTVRKCKTFKNFPFLKSRTIYWNILPKAQPTVESRYPLYNWPLIW